jgi:hypothetical protein
MPIAIEGEAVRGDELRRQEHAQVAQRRVEDVDGRRAARLRRHLGGGVEGIGVVRDEVFHLRGGPLRHEEPVLYCSLLRTTDH